MGKPQARAAARDAFAVTFKYQARPGASRKMMPDRVPQWIGAKVQPQSVTAVRCRR